ncbi:phage holin family protein [Bacillus sp. FJAT-27245]|uniref:phage holin family protein n=1 Tax=Bacillus sp. FJAT-27245 TaxID=1684144 RepID=UPI0006A7CEB1|nr:phage holin family protein [Bacillus sp. FJAT-27245]
MDFIQILNQNYYFLVPVLWIIGFALKKTPRVPDWSIIWFLFGISLVLAWIAFGFNIDAIINGIIAAGTAVFGHQAWKQSLEGLDS